MSKKKSQEIQDFVCPVTKAMSFIKGRWTFPIVHTLMSGTKRFKELERSVEGINTRMLVKELKSLEAMGVVKRQAYATVPQQLNTLLRKKEWL